jgi:uncharacterized membrane protein YfbV (UPF0208 family)
MKDVTDEVRVVPKERKLGKRILDELWHHDEKIGHVETQGWVIQHKNYAQKFVPKRNVYELRIYRYFDHELAALQER